MSIVNSNENSFFLLILFKRVYNLIKIGSKILKKNGADSLNHVLALYLINGFSCSKQPNIYIIPTPVFSFGCFL